MKKVIVFLILLLIPGVALSGEYGLWREPAPVLQQGEYKSIILDRGKLTKAVRDSNNKYLFTEKGAGVKPLVFIGTPTQIVAFLEENQTRVIESRIKGLEEIYMGITNYTPEKRFSGLFPLHDLFIRAVENVQKFLLIGSVITDAAAIPSDLKDFYNKMHELDVEHKKQGEVLYVKFSYLPEEGMIKIGHKTVSFGKILKMFENK